MDISDATTDMILKVTIGGLVVSLVLLLVYLLFCLQELTNNSTRKLYQFYLAGLDAFFFMALCAKIPQLLDDNNIIATYFGGLCDYIGVTFSVLAELEILRYVWNPYHIPLLTRTTKKVLLLIELYRLLQVILPVSPKTISIFRKCVIIYVVTTGGYRIFDGLPFITGGFRNFLLLWGYYGALAWYGGVGIYILAQSTFITILMYKQYTKISSANKDIIKSECIKIVVGISIMFLLVIVGMGILVIGMSFTKKYPTKNGSIVNKCLAGINGCVKAVLVFIYPSIFEGIKGFCLSKSSAASSFKKKSMISKFKMATDIRSKMETKSRGDVKSRTK
ncbi:hypothetical protein BC833DRAFT_581127 [Globomyces pollinis-pini]|nr:hypothetical protein BC833DRAFT_581127 [Globomyces pollinis-pini]